VSIIFLNILQCHLCHFILCSLCLETAYYSWRVQSWSEVSQLQFIQHLANSSLYFLTLFSLFSMDVAITRGISLQVVVVPPESPRLAEAQVAFRADEFLPHLQHRQRKYIHIFTAQLYSIECVAQLTLNMLAAGWSAGVQRSASGPISNKLYHYSPHMVLLINRCLHEWSCYCSANLQLLKQLCKKTNMKQPS